MNAETFDRASFDPGTVHRGFLTIQEDYFGRFLKFPYIFIKGPHEGPSGVILAGIHGDELNGIQIVHRLADIIDAEQLHGSLILLPVANLHGFSIQSRYLSDRRDLNRLFPGTIDGSEGSRLAHLIYQNFVKGSDFGIDLHSASYNRWNYPHIRGNMRSERVRFLAKSFGSDLVIHSQGVLGSLRREATRRNIPFILFEAGQINRFEKEVIQIGVSGILSVLQQLEMLNELSEGFELLPAARGYYKKSYWVRATNGGLFLPHLKPGDVVEENDILGIIKSVNGEIVSSVKARSGGAILGFNLHPQVLPGRALYHICHDHHEL